MLQCFFCYRTRLRKRNNEEESKTDVKIDSSEKKENFENKTEVKIKKEFIDTKLDVKTALDKLPEDIETVTISDEEDGIFFLFLLALHKLRISCRFIVLSSKFIFTDDKLVFFLEGREVLSFNPRGSFEEKPSTYSSVRDLFGTDECVYVMDAKSAGNIGRFLNVSRLYQF